MYICGQKYKTVCLSICLPVCLSACVPVCLSACLHVCLSVCMSACLPVRLSVCLPVRLSALSTCPPVRLSVCRLSVCLYVVVSVMYYINIITKDAEFVKELEERVVRTLQGSLEKKGLKGNAAEMEIVDSSRRAQKRIINVRKEVRPNYRIQISRICDTGGRRL